MVLDRLPPFLVIALERFRDDRQKGRIDKNESPILVDETLTVRVSGSVMACQWWRVRFPKVTQNPPSVRPSEKEQILCHFSLITPFFFFTAERPHGHAAFTRGSVFSFPGTPRFLFPRFRCIFVSNHWSYGGSFPQNLWIWTHFEDESKRHSPFWITLKLVRNSCSPRLPVLKLQ